MQNLRKLATSSMEAREMLKYLNDMQKLKAYQTQKNFYSSGSHSPSNNYLIVNKSLRNYPSLEHDIKFEGNKVGVILRAKPGFSANLYYLLGLLGVGCFNLDFYLLVRSSKDLPLFSGLGDEVIEELGLRDELIVFGARRFI
jgi:hypothetical protein